ncbi:diguanylate cyclase (GGDEF)-like protein [Saccharopolyspora lacisalsi]|uniref:Diguanylate cyclase (GGDEF)-like protein n=1 Tax=Halosaccharopolyspora lacisalsi TaxID=1000566 RepID=A0A839DMR9_9PSEU|nr:GGDEF domain-containing protein [Halosaccharopolyspora lacisalsi]MBA8822804.1 diguanylate cyclase (GGDEF)-like protein [Halosaccharopolyspora lacisalsi]
MELHEETATTLGEMSDAWLVGRARELNAVGQHSGSRGWSSSLHEADELLREARRRGEPRVVAQLIRHCVALRLSNPELVGNAGELLDELLNHTRRHGLLVLQADAYALRGKQAFAAGSEDNALTELAEGLAILEDELIPDATLGRRSWERLLATALIDIGVILTQLGIYDMANDIMARAHHRIRESGGPHEITVHMINRCRMLIGWGLRLERLGDAEAAVDRFHTAADLATAINEPWHQSLFPRRADKSAAEQIPVLGAARALAAPGPEHLEFLENLETPESSLHAGEQVIVVLALSRCLHRTHRTDEAVKVLAETRDRLGHDAAEPTLRISLTREYAHLTDDVGSDSWRDYARELEDELWEMRQTRMNTLKTRLANTQLSREHGAISQQALQDPLTGLPNRRALDRNLDKLLEQSDSQPLSVALVDLDGFKTVNDRSSHAEGDEVLRVVTRTLRDTLRGDDMVARYGGDEFVVLLPTVTLAEADAALGRTVDAVGQLPMAVSRGVTLSIGVVTMRPQETNVEVLARADAAMYRAKRGGGNSVVALSGDQTPSAGHAWVPPEAV